MIMEIYKSPDLRGESSAGEQGQYTIQSLKAYEAGELDGETPV